MKKLKNIIILIIILVIAWKIFSIWNVVFNKGNIKEGVIGESYVNKGLEYTVDEICITDIIDGFISPDYLRPIDDNSEYMKRYIAGKDAYISEYGVSPEDDSKTFVTITYTISNISKDDYTYTPNTTVDYDHGYEYKMSRLIWRVKDGDKWTVTNKNTYWNGRIVMEKLTQTKYEVREVIEIPKQVLFDPDKDLKLYIQNKYFNIRGLYNK